MIIIDENQAQYLLKHLKVNQEKPFTYIFHKNGNITQTEIKNFLHFDKTLKSLYGSDCGIINLEKLLSLKKNKIKKLKALS